MEELISDIKERVRTLGLDKDIDRGWSLSEPSAVPTETSIPDNLGRPLDTPLTLVYTEENEYVFSVVENVYIVQEREFIARRLPIYKIGMTTREPHERFKGYSKSTDVKLCMSVNDSKVVESMLIEAFKTKFIQRTDIGTESFQGDILEMEELFTSIVHKYKRSPLGDPNAPRRSRRHPTPLTLELIRKTIPLYSHNMIKNGKEGFKEFLNLLIVTPEGPNMKCVNKEKLVFSRLSGVDKDKEKWIKDGKKFINNVFSEVGNDGKSLLRRVNDYWLEVKDAHLRSTNQEDKEKYEALLKEVGALAEIFKNEKVIRSRFVKSVLSSIASEEA